MNDHFRALPWYRQAFTHVLAASLFICAIFIFAFLQVTLRKAFELTDPWQTFAIFVGSLAACAAYYRIVVY